MNEKELTTEMIEDACKCHNCNDNTPCSVKALTKGYNAVYCVDLFAQALKAEKAKPKYDVWKDAPEWAIETYRVYKNTKGNMTTSEAVFRELPKTKARLIAESIAKNRWMDPDTLCDEIEKAILEAQGDGK